MWDMSCADAIRYKALNPPRVLSPDKWSINVNYLPCPLYKCHFCGKVGGEMMFVNAKQTFLTAGLRVHLDCLKEELNPEWIDPGSPFEIEIRQILESR